MVFFSFFFFLLFSFWMAEILSMNEGMMPYFHDSDVQKRGNEISYFHIPVSSFITGGSPG